MCLKKTKKQIHVERNKNNLCGIISPKILCLKKKENNNNCEKRIYEDVT